MLSVVAIASIIGTVVKQSEPYNNYLIQFGQFWFPIFEAFDVYNIYQAFWFLIILLFLVVSTSLCVSRNSPKIIKDIRRFQGALSHNSFKKFKNYYEFSSSHSLNSISEILNKEGFRIKAGKDKDILVAKKRRLTKTWIHIYPSGHYCNKYWWYFRWKSLLQASGIIWVQKN